MAAQRQPALNVLLVGKSGVGKSATGNSLLGREEFIESVGESVTKACKEATATRDGVQITVIDTPGVHDTGGLEAAKVIDDYITSKKCELHAICLVMGTSRPTPEEKQAIAELCKLFGMAMLQYLFIVITSAENIDRGKQKLTDFLKLFVTPETDILNYCIQKDRVFGIDNFNDEKKKQQIPELLKTVHTMVSENEGAMYTRHNLEQNKRKLEEEERILKEEKDKIDREKEEQREKELEINKAEEAVKQKLQKDMEALKKKEEAIEKKEKQIDERRKQHNSNVDRMVLLEAAVKAVMTVSTAGAVAGLTAEVAASVIGVAATALGVTAAAPVVAIAAPVIGAVAGVTAVAYIIKKLPP